MVECWLMRIRPLRWDWLSVGCSRVRYTKFASTLEDRRAFTLRTQSFVLPCLAFQLPTGICTRL
ncbi:MAG TPA: hypothetical protein DIT76_00795 [Spartobacteria bacterium]|nr:hypothetical protein [Spartobacteria bacterium]HCP90579.1 hypothetical protein [Spartobacteria bacterium]